MSTLDQHTSNHCIWKNLKTDSPSPAIMESLDSLSLCNRDAGAALNNSPFQSNLSLHGVSSLNDPNPKHSKIPNTFKSFLLIDGNEYLKVNANK
jgi:hypothetical protein